LGLITEGDGLVEVLALALAEGEAPGEGGPEGLGITASALGLTEGLEAVDGVAVGSLGREGDIEFRLVRGGAGVDTVCRTSVGIQAARPIEAAIIIIMIITRIGN
jgi:hypothetical protein